ncbi:BON domain-containing protein [Rhizobium leucaenae]|uniref:BON domain-containing protein n=1 Tax=Rhizobium leucaenae TaxID=29450 RepID=A0A7W6ZQA0_9HYPH|nr:BON domain-containing protein [Rhizobium leucaenae]MBB4566766.1 hypothetical protein [Rhizobium leucaenae]MBB6301339.1 hypothetical protein [Rhizobium leucaenae]
MSSDIRPAIQIDSIPEQATAAASVRDKERSKRSATHLRLVFNNPTPLPRDADLISAVLRKFEASALDTRDMTVTAKGADVTLRGTIRGEGEILRAVSVASSVRGVRVVHDELFGR